ncbi:MAG TPA: nodulation protein NfeD [Candidatus Binataceae bacterium]|nr:nodulation protein NfeD [Candidatus Binataceae bacterium]
MRQRGAIDALAARAFAIVCALALAGIAGASSQHDVAAPQASAAPPVGAAATPAAVPAMTAAAAPWVCLLKVDGSINPAVAAFIEDGIGYASSRHAGALVIELDTPGGLLGSAQRIVKDLLNAPLPTIVYVSPSGASAASAGTFITEAAAIAAMAPGTTIGAAHPVGEGGSEIKGVVGKKIENYTASFAGSIARERGRNQQWIEQAVRESVAIGEAEALKRNVIDIVAPDLRSLLVQASGREVKVGGRTVKLELAGAVVRRIRMTLGQALLNVLADPNIVYLLMLAGIVGIYFEFGHPGFYLPGVVGAICLLLALGSFEVLPINLTGFLLLMLGIALLIAEVFVTSYGVLGIGGVIAFVIGSLFLVDSAQTNLEVNRGMIAGAAVAMSAIILGLGWVVLRERRRRPTTGREGMVGEVGEVREAIAPGAPGRVFVHGEHWRAASSETLAIGARARVIAVRGLEIEVRAESRNGVFFQTDAERRAAAPVKQ